MVTTVSGRNTPNAISSRPCTAHTDHKCLLVIYSECDLVHNRRYDDSKYLHKLQGNFAHGSRSVPPHTSVDPH